MQTRIERRVERGGVSQPVLHNGPTLILHPHDLSNENTIVRRILIASFHFS